MTIKIKVQVLKLILLLYAGYIGPNTYDYIRFLEEKMTSDYDWNDLAELIAKLTDPYLLEYVCQRAKSLDIQEVEMFESLVSMLDARDE